MSINQATLTLAQQLQNPTLTLFSKTTAIVTDPLVVLILSITIATALYLNNKKTESFLLLSTSIVTALTIKTLKYTFKILRPPSMLIQETSYSMPSGHTTFAIVFFGLLAFIFAKPKHKTPVILTSILLTLIIAFTRLYLQVHWLTDIIAGIITGTLILVTSITIYKKLTSRNQKSRNPRSK